MGWLIHVLVAYIFNSGRGVSTIAREMVIAGTFMAPVVNSYRFVVGGVEEQDETDGAASQVDPVAAYLTIKGIEVGNTRCPAATTKSSSRAPFASSFSLSHPQPPHH